MKVTKAKEPIKIGREFFEESNHTSIAWLAGAGFLINSRGTIILIDPVLMTMCEDSNISEAGLKMISTYPIYATDIPKADIVLYTHPDKDHLGQNTAEILTQLRPRFIGPHTVFKRLVELNVRPKVIDTCRIGDKIRVNGIMIEVLPADHPWQLQDPPHLGKPFRREDCCGFIITTPDVRCFFPGDTRLMEEHLHIQDINILALDVSLDPYHLGHLGAKVLANSLPEALLIPMHYGTYDAPDKAAHCGDPYDVINTIEDGNKRGRVLAPGEVLIFSNRREIQ